MIVRQNVSVVGRTVIVRGDTGCSLMFWSVFSWKKPGLGSFSSSDKLIENQALSWFLKKSNFR